MGQIREVYKVVEMTIDDRYVSAGASGTFFEVEYTPRKIAYPPKWAQELGFPLMAFSYWGIADRFKNEIVPGSGIVWIAEAEIIPMPADFCYLSYNELDRLSNIIAEDPDNPEIIKRAKEFLQELKARKLCLPDNGAYSKATVFCKWIKLIRTVGFSFNWGGRVL